MTIEELKLRSNLFIFDILEILNDLMTKIGLKNLSQNCTCS